MIDRVWLYPGLALTALAALVALAHAPHPADLLPAMGILPAWMVAAGFFVVIHRFVLSVIARDPSPGRTLLSAFRANGAMLAGLALCMALAGINMIAFLWIKPLLNLYVPFRADPLLAAIDHALFLGHDPWRVFAFAAVPGAGLIYHPIWFITIIGALLLAFSAPPSPQRSALIVSYFFLWTVAGPRRP